MGGSLTLHREKAELKYWDIKKGGNPEIFFEFASLGNEYLTELILYFIQKGLCCR